MSLTDISTSMEAVMDLHSKNRRYLSFGDSVSDSASNAPSGRAVRASTGGLSTNITGKI